MDIESKLIELAERMSENIDKQAEVSQSAIDSVKRMFKWFCITLVIISLTYAVSDCINHYNRESFDYNKMEVTK